MKGRSGTWGGRQNLCLQNGDMDGFAAPSQTPSIALQVVFLRVPLVSPLGSNRPPVYYVFVVLKANWHL